MKNFIKKLDIFSVSPKLYIKKQDTFKTIYGGIMTLIVLGLIVAASINFSQNFIHKRSPNIVTSQKSFEEIPQFSLANFMTGFFINSFFYGKVYDPTIFTVSGGYLKFYITNEGNQTFNFQNINMEKCTMNRFNPENPVVKRLRMDMNYCFSEEEAKNISLEGGWGQSQFDLVYVDFNICMNNTENGNHCKTQEFIDMVVKSSGVGVDIMDTLIDLNDYAQPIKQQIFTSYTVGSTKLSKELNIFVKSGIIKTDKGWLLEEFEDRHFLKVDREREYDREMNENGNIGNFARIYFRMSNTYEIYERKYDKLQNVVANIAAIANLLLRIVGIILLPYTSLDYKKSLSNKLFDFDLHVGKIFSKKEKTTSHGKNNLEGGKNCLGKLIKSQKLQFSFIEKIMLPLNFIRKKNRKIELLNKAFDKIMSRLDVFFILKKLIEFEKLKLILLNENQIRLLEYLPKPLISKQNTAKEQNKYDDNTAVNFFSIWDELVEKNYDKFLKRRKGEEAFLKILKQESMDPIDLKLVTFLKAKKCFEPKDRVNEKDPFSVMDFVFDEGHISRINDMINDKSQIELTNKGNL